MHSKPVVNEFKLTRGRVATLGAMIVGPSLVGVGVERIVSVDRPDSTAAAPFEPEQVEPLDYGAGGGRVADLRAPFDRRPPIGSCRSFAGANRVDRDGRELPGFPRRQMGGVRSPSMTSISRASTERTSIGSREGRRPRSTPTWSPDGNEIVFVSDADTVSVVDVRTGISSTLLRLPSERVWLPDFSGDGRTILFTRTRGRGTWLEMWTIPAAGWGATQVLQHACIRLLLTRWRRHRDHHAGACG